MIITSANIAPSFFVSLSAITSADDRCISTVSSQKPSWGGSNETRVGSFRGTHNCLFVCFPIHKQINLILFFVSKPLTNLGTFRALSSSSSSTLNVTPAGKGYAKQLACLPLFLPPSIFRLPLFLTSNPNFSN